MMRMAWEHTGELGGRSTKQIDHISSAHRNQRKRVSRKWGQAIKPQKLIKPDFK